MFLLVLLKSFIVGISIIGAVIGFIGFLYRAIHYIEEYPNRAKEKIKILAYTVWAFHLLLLYRGFSIWVVLFSCLAQGLFYNLLEDYPNIETGGAGFVTAAVVAFINHGLFLTSMLRSQFGLFEILFYFFGIVWALPFSIFISLTANDEIITIGGNKKPIRRTMVGKVLDTILSKNNAWEDR